MPTLSISAAERAKIVLWLRSKGHLLGPALTAVNNANDIAKMRWALIDLHNLTETQYIASGVG